MSVSHSSSIIVGVALSDLYETKINTDTKTKYNENTGKPYDTEIKKLYAKFGNLELPPVEARKKDQYAWRDEFYQDWKFLENIGLEIHLPSYDGYGDNDYIVDVGIVGISVCSGDHKENGCISLDKLMETVEVVKKDLANFGYSGEVSIFSMSSCG